MSRDDGFTVADVATGLLDDPKVRALWRELRDQGRMGHALALHMATLLASWRQGCRVRVDEAAPVWMECDAELIAALVKVRLLDRSGRLPSRSWDGWFGPAFARREVRRESGRLGGKVSRKPPVSNAEASVKRRLSVGEPDRTVPTVPTVPIRTVRQDRSDARDVPSNGTNGRGGGTLSELVTPEALAAIGKRP
jgi:hypothetical protein